MEAGRGRTWQAHLQRYKSVLRSGGAEIQKFSDRFFHSCRTAVDHIRVIEIKYFHR